MFASMSRNAAGLPDISRPTSKPSVIPSSFCTSGSFVSRTFTARVTPIFCASSSRYGLMSVITVYRAPACRATAAAMIPIGPAPVTSTSSPSTWKRKRRVHRVAERIEDRRHVHGIDLS